MKRILVLILAMVLLLTLAATPVMANGPTNAGGNSTKWVDPWGYDGIYIFPAELYIGPDYGAGAMETLCSDGTWIDVIEDATLLAKGHYFSDEEFTEKDWVDYKFWLDKDHPVDMLLQGVTDYTATKFIFLKWMIGSTGDIILIAYK